MSWSASVVRVLLTNHELVHRELAFVQTLFQIHPPSPENVEAVFGVVASAPPPHGSEGLTLTAGFLKYGSDQTRTLTLLKSEPCRSVRGDSLWGDITHRLMLQLGVTCRSQRPQQLTVGTDSLPEPPGVIRGTAWFGTAASALFRLTWWCLNITGVHRAAPSLTFTPARLAAVPEAGVSHETRALSAAAPPFKIFRLFQHMHL